MAALVLVGGGTYAYAGRGDGFTDQVVAICHDAQREVHKSARPRSAGTLFAIAEQGSRRRVDRLLELRSEAGTHAQDLTALIDGEARVVTVAQVGAMNFARSGSSTETTELGRELILARRSQDARYTALGVPHGCVY